MKLKKYLIIFILMLLPLGVFAGENNNANTEILEVITLETGENNVFEGTAETIAVTEVAEPAEKSKESIKAYIDYNYLNEKTPLLSKYTKYESETGLIKKFQPSFVYRGFFDVNMTEHQDVDTFYDSALVDLNLTGEFQAPIEFKSQYNFLSFGNGNYFHRLLKDQYLAFKYIPHHKVYIGQYRTSVGKEGAASSYTLPFLNRSQLAKNYGNAHAIGAKIQGKYDLVDYSLGVTSSDRNFYDFFPGVEFTGWADLKPLGKTDGRWGELEIGGGINAGRRHENYMVISTALSYKYKKIGLFAEYGISEGSNGSKGFTDKSGQGVVLTATYNITKKLQLLARYDVFDSDRHKSNKTTTEYTAGINYLIKGSALKLVINYIYRHVQSGNDSNRILVGFQVIL